MVFGWFKKSKELGIAIPVAALLAFSANSADAQINQYSNVQKTRIEVANNKFKILKENLIFSMDNYARIKNWQKYFYLEDKSGNLIIDSTGRIMIFDTLAGVQKYKASNFALNTVIKSRNPFSRIEIFNSF